VARRLRRDRIAARTVVLKLKLARRRAAGPRGYPLLSRRATLREPTDDGGVISQTASELLTRAELQEPVRLLGVGVTNLVAEGSGQLALFPASEPRERRARLNRALDEIEARFGSAAVKRGSLDAAERAGLSLQIKRGEKD
jgi:DNA polymerase-4